MHVAQCGLKAGRTTISKSHLQLPTQVKLDTLAARSQKKFAFFLTHWIFRHSLTVPSPQVLLAMTAIYLLLAWAVLSLRQSYIIPRLKKAIRMKWYVSSVRLMCIPASSKELPDLINIRKRNSICPKPYASSHELFIHECASQLITVKAMIVSTLVFPRLLKFWDTYQILLRCMWNCVLKWAWFSKCFKRRQNHDSVKFGQNGIK